MPCRVAGHCCKPPPIPENAKPEGGKKEGGGNLMRRPSKETVSDPSERLALPYSQHFPQVTTSEMAFGGSPKMGFNKPSLARFLLFGTFCAPPHPLTMSCPAISVNAATVNDAPPKRGIRSEQGPQPRRVVGVFTDP